MAISPDLTFSYDLTVQESGRFCAGVGKGHPVMLGLEPLAGLNPRFELSEGWLTLVPPRGWKHSLPLHWFSDVDRQQLNFRSETRNLSSFSVFVGEALGSVLRTGDEFKFSRDFNGDYRYKLVREMEPILGAGTVGTADEGGQLCVWQEFDRHPIQGFEDLQKQHPNLPIATHREVPQAFVTARLMRKLFHLSDGDEAEVRPYFVYLARSNKKVPRFAFEFTPRAVHGAGHLDELSSTLIVDSARQLLSHRLRLL